MTRGIGGQFTRSLMAISDGREFGTGRTCRPYRTNRNESFLAKKMLAAKRPGQVTVT